jgi:hypothetical protein
MFNSIKKILNGIISMTSKKSDSERIRKVNLKTNIPQLDEEQEDLFAAADILEAMGNEPGITTTEFYRVMLMSDLDNSMHERVFLAAIAIESMLQIASEQDYETIH